MKLVGVLATTHVDNHNQRITLEALEDAADQINNGPKPILGLEHDSILPPMGKILRAWVEPRDDGEFQLVAEQEIFENIHSTILPSGLKLIKEESEADRSPFVDRYQASGTEYEIVFDPVNFESKEAINLYTQDIRVATEVEFTETFISRKSATPDPEVIIKLAEAVGTYLLTAKAIEKVGDKVIDLAFAELTKFIGFLKTTITAGFKYLHPKGRPVTYIFVISGSPMIEFALRTTDANSAVEAIRLEKVQDSVNEALELHAIFSATKIQYLLNTKGDWEFNFLLTENGAVIGTEASFGRRSKRFELYKAEAITKKAANKSDDKAPVKKRRAKKRK